MRILIIEDSNTVRFMIVKQLKVFGYSDLSAVETAEEGFELMKKKQYDLLLLDWNLPKMSGLELLQFIRSSPEFASINVVMVTTMHDRKYILQALKLGLQGYILKPIDYKILLEKIKEIESKLDV